MTFFIDANFWLTKAFTWDIPTCVFTLGAEYSSVFWIHIIYTEGSWFKDTVLSFKSQGLSHPNSTTVTHMTLTIDT